MIEADIITESQQQQQQEDDVNSYFTLFSDITGLFYIVAGCLAIGSLFGLSLINHLFEYGKARKSTQTWWLIPKQSFTHFYITAIVSCLVVSPQNWLLLFHVCRRCYECFFVHKWGKNAKIHFIGYLGGVGHYIFLPFVLSFPSNNNNGMLQLNPLLFPSQEGSFSANNIIITLQFCLKIILIGFNLWMQYEQHVHHVMLAKLKTKKDDNDNNSNNDGYKLPKGRWFNYVLSPHYLAEILLYFSFLGLYYLQQQQQQQHDNNGNTLNDSTGKLIVSSFWYKINSPTLITIIKQCKIYNQVCLMFWVISNLTITATSNLIWYQNKFDLKKGQAPFAIFPFII